MDVSTLHTAESVSAPGTVWTIDPVHSTIGFSIKHMAVATVRGRFGSFRGSIRFDADRPAAASVEVEIDAASIDTGIAFRDEHLRSADFFDVTAYPTIAFRSTRIEVVDPLKRDRWIVVGDLTMSGVTCSVELAVEQMGNGPELWDVEAVSFRATATISRKDFGLGYGLLLERGGIVIGDDVKIEIDVQVVEGPIA